MRKYFIGIFKSHIADLDLRFPFIKIVLETLCHKLLYILYLLYFLAFVYILFGLVKNFRLVCRRTTTGKNFQLEQNLLLSLKLLPNRFGAVHNPLSNYYGKFPLYKTKKTYGKVHHKFESSSCKSAFGYSSSRRRRR